MLFAFDQFELDVAVCELRRDGRPVPLQPRVFDLLLYLIENRERVVSQQELIHALWSGQQLNPIAVPWSVSHARRALGEDGDHRFIETFRGRGYRFVADVHTTRGRAAAEDAQPHEPAMHPLDDAPFVGRADVMGQLGSAVDAALAGRGRLYLLAGEPGIGKTRTARELERLARARGAHAFYARCSGAGGTPVFWPFIQVLRALTREAGIPQLVRRTANALLPRLGPSFAVNMEEDSGLVGLSESARFWLLDDLLTCLRRAGERHAAVVTLDDLHHADEGTLEALALLAPELERMRWLILGTARSLPGSAQARAADLALRLRPCERIALSGLTLEDIERCLETWLGEPPTPRLTRAVHARTEGNPLFVQEVLRLLEQQRRSGGAISAEAVRLPHAARGFIEERIAALPQATRRVLEAACVIGEEFELAVLQCVVELPVEALLARLDDAQQAHLVEPRSPETRLGFTHGLLRDALYEALPMAERVRLHGRVGIALESLSLLQPRYGELAFHFQRALPDDHYERVVRYARLAAHDAQRVFAYEEAANYYGWALSAQPHVAPEDGRGACELLLESAAALLGAGRRGEWRSQCERAMALARREALPELLVEAACLLRPSVFFARVPDPSATAALEDALRQLPESAKAARAKALTRLACLPPHGNSVTRSRQLSAEALNLARQVGRRSLLIEALKARLHALSPPDTFAELLAAADELLQVQGAPLAWHSGDAHLARFRALLQRGDGPGADQALEAFGQIAQRLQLPRGIWHHERLRAVRCLQAGELARAQRWFEELQTRAKRLSIHHAERLYQVQASALAYERTGHRDDQAFLATRWANVAPTYKAESILIAAESGDRVAARANLQRTAEHGFAAVLDDPYFLPALVQLGRAAAALGARDEAASLYRLLEPHAACNAVNVFFLSLGPVHDVLGAIADLLGQRDAAQRHLEAALAIQEALELRTLAARTRLALAELLRGDGRSRARARALAGQAQADAQRFGMPWLAERAALLLA